jgi:uncharacterized protein (TIGR03067 family)
MFCKVTGPALAVIVLAVPALSAEDDPAKERERLQGLWQAVELQVRGKNAPEEVVRKFQIRVQGDKWITRTGETEREATFEVNPQSRPKAIDLTPSDGPERGNKIPAGIYTLEGDQLRLCIRRNAKDKGRPADFTSDAEAEQSVVTLQRVKE